MVRTPCHPRTLLLASAAIAVPTAIVGQDLDLEGDFLLLPEIVLDAEMLATLETTESRISGERLESEYQGAGLGTVLQSIPGVSVDGGGAGDAEMGINIRGMQDQGRVAVTIDGVRQNFAKSGHGANGTFSADQEMLREVSVVRGPGGKSGAIAGSVAMRTVSAEDLILPGATSGGEIRVRYGTESALPTLHGAFAAQLDGNVDVTIAATRASSTDYTAPDGTHVFAAQDKLSLLGSLGVTTDEGWRLAVSAEALNQGYMVAPNSPTPDDTELRKTTYRLNAQNDDIWGGWAVDANLYRTTTRVEGTELDATFVPTGTVSSYETSTTGLLLEAGRLLDIAGKEHDVSVAFEGFQDDVDTRARVGSLTPSGTRRVASLDFEDRVDFDAFAATFGVSFDAYELIGSGTENSGAAISPRVSATMPIGSDFQITASFARTFRPPSLNESMVKGEHPPPSFDVIPNPDLRPERATAFEFALGYSREAVFTDTDMLDLRATAFRNTVEDYIAMEWVGGLFGGAYQFQNKERVRLEGIELEANYESDRVFARVAGQFLHGTDLSTDLKLADIVPTRLVVSGGLYSADGLSTYGARLTASGAVTDASDTVLTPSWKTLDLFYSRELSDQALVSVSLNNVLNEDYTIHRNTDPQKGFNAQASLVLKF